MGTVLTKEAVDQIARLYDADSDRKACIFPAGYLDRCHLTAQQLTDSGYTYPRSSHLIVTELQKIIDWKYPRGKTRGYAAHSGLRRR